MSKVYAWHKYEDAEKAGLFEKFDNFWIFESTMRKPSIYRNLSYMEENQYNKNVLVKPIEQEPAPNIEFLDD